MENEPGPLDSDDGAPRGSWAGAWFIPTAVGAWKSTRGPQDCSQDASPCDKHHQDKSVCTHRDGVQGVAPWGLQPGGRSSENLRCFWGWAELTQRPEDQSLGGTSTSLLGRAGKVDNQSVCLANNSHCFLRPPMWRTTRQGLYTHDRTTPWS